MHDHNGHDVQRATSALWAIDATCDRDTWVRLAMAAKESGIDLDEFSRWSSAASNYSARDTRNVWQSIRRGQGIGPGTLFQAARAAGWRDERASATRERPEKAPRRPQEPPQARPAGEGAAAALWARCAPATAAHAYVASKGAQGVPLDDLRVVAPGDAVRVMGEPMDNALVVPCRRPDGSLSTVQLVTTGAVAERLKAAGKPTKLSLPGCRIEGWHMVGKAPPGSEVFVAEGIGTGWAAWRATGRPCAVTFGASRFRAVAQALRQRDPTSTLILCPDRGLEEKAQEIARELGNIKVAEMPASWPANADLADLAQAEGVEAVERVLDAARRPPHEPHPLAEFAPVDAEVRPPRWIIPGFVAEGITMIAGEAGAGKTTCLLPLALVAAHLCASGDSLRPRHWRHVIFVSEDVAQARRVLAGIRDHGFPPLDPRLVAERFHLVEAQRLPPDDVVRAGRIYRDLFTRHIDGVEVLPLVVLDTRSAVIALDDENDNSEASRAVAALKQRFEGLPTWIVGHLPKALAGRNEARAMSMRGAGAWEADAHQTMFLVREGEQRFLVLGKRRFEAAWPELSVESQWIDTTAPDEFGIACTVRLRWGIPRPPEQTRQETKAQAADQARRAAEAELRQEVRHAVQLAEQGGHPLTKEGVKAQVRRKSADVARTVEALLAERWLIEVPIPAAMRSNPRRASFLVDLSTEEHDAVLRGEPVPEAKLAIPASLTRSAA